jgi:Zn-dependent protease
MLEAGYVTVARWKGTPIRLHWTTPIGMLVFGGLRFAPGFWLGYLLLIVLHEMGHAWLVRRMGLRADSIDVHAFGGVCRFGGAVVTPWQRAVVAWGGVLAQSLLLVPALAVAFGMPLPPIAFVNDLLDALVRVNLWLIAINLMPFRPCDGADAWQIFRLRRQRRARAAALAARERIEVRVPVDHLELGDVDEEAVREMVRRVLAQAAREAAARTRRDA